MKRMKALVLLLVSLCLVLGNAQVSLASTKTEKWTYLGKYKITCYCSCEKCCGKNGGKVTASGTTPTRFRTCAAPKNLPFGTRLYIDTFGQRVVEDRGGAVKHNHIDIYTIDHATAAKYAVQYQDVWIIEEK